MLIPWSHSLFTIFQLCIVISNNNLDPIQLLLLLLLLFLLAPRCPQLQFPTTVFGAGDKHASVRDKTQIPRMKKSQMRK